MALVSCGGGEAKRRALADALLERDADEGSGVVCGARVHAPCISSLGATRGGAEAYGFMAEGTGGASRCGSPTPTLANPNC